LLVVVVVALVLWALVQMVALLTQNQKMENILRVLVEMAGVMEVVVMPVWSHLLHQGVG